MRHSRFGIIAGIVVLAAFGTTACSSDETESGGPESPVSESVDVNTTDVDDEVEEIDAAPAPSGSDLTRENFADRITDAQLAAGSAHIVTTITMEGEEESLTSESDVVYSTDPFEQIVRQAVEVPGLGEGTVILVDGVVYMNSPEQAGEMWLRFDESSAALVGLDSIAEQADPRGEADLFASAISDFTVDPDAETINGVSTSMLTILVDTAALYDDEEVRAQIGETLTVIYHVGADDLPHRVTTKTGPITMTMDFSRWGEPLDVAAPSEDEIIDFAEFLQEQQ